MRHMPLGGGGVGGGWPAASMQKSTETAVQETRADGVECRSTFTQKINSSGPTVDVESVWFAAI